MTDWPFGDLQMFGYDVAMVDFPWEFKLRSAKGIAKSPQAHYKTMTLEECAAYPVGNLLRAGGVLWLWGTWPLIDLQGGLMRDVWGAPPRTGGSWAKRTKTGKLRWGPGYILRSVCEPFLIGSVGDRHGMRGPSLNNLIETVSDAVVDGLAREHSRKPDEAYALLEALTPDPGYRRVDVFGRQSRPGWDVWGNEATKFDKEDQCQTLKEDRRPTLIT